MISVTRGCFSVSPDSLGRAFTLRSRFLAEAPHVPFDLVGVVLNVVRRATFDVFDQAGNIALQYDKIPRETVRYRDPSPSMRS
jgi:hypothetical protein